MEPQNLSLAEIRSFMLQNNCKVTNHALVKHFKKFLTNPETQDEARKKFKAYVNILAAIKNENNQKYLLLRKKYLTECPNDDEFDNSARSEPSSPGGYSLASEGTNSPYRQPPPYKPPPEVASSPSKSQSFGQMLPSSKICLSPPQFQPPPPPPRPQIPILQTETKETYRDCINEFQLAVRKIDPSRISEPEQNEIEPELPPRKNKISRDISHDENKENNDECRNLVSSSVDENIGASVKETTRKFNRMASEEEAKSPPIKKKPEKERTQQQQQQQQQQHLLDSSAPLYAPEVTISHPKAKQWIVSMAKGNYQELAKLASDNPELVWLKDPATTALHWASKHGNEDIIKMVAGTYKANVNARTNGGYTPLHVAMQFGRDNIFELLCNVYKADRDVMDWSGNKPLDYRKQRTSVSASTFSKIKARRKHLEKDLGFLRIGSLNARVKKTTEAFSNFLGSGNSNQPYYPQGSQTNSMRGSVPSPIHEKFVEKIHKSWGSLDNIKKSNDDMPAPKNVGLKRKSKRKIYPNDPVGYASMPSTPNNVRASIGIVPQSQDSDSDSACGFDSNWSVTNSSNNSGTMMNASNFI